MKKLFPTILLVCLCAIISQPVTAAPAVSLDENDLAVFLDEFFTSSLETYKIPGAVVAVVGDGRVLYAKGYGYADLDSRQPVDTASTVFDVGSVSKLFTYTAVMQLVEQGRLDLHGDVNQYLTHFQVPSTFPQSITVAHLLTHTTGFDEWDIGAAAHSTEQVIPLCDYLAQRLPPRLRPPGEQFAYSNHGTALAGCLVEEISGQPFAEYISEHILVPLGMNRSSFGWPPDLMANMATGYELRGDSLYPFPVYYRHYAPAGELKTTAIDITHFMLAHLQNGSYGDTQILQTETIALMHQQQYRHDDRLPGFTYGFFEDRINGHRLLMHGGDTNPTFSSLLLLLPDEKVGLFVAHNRAEWNLRPALVAAFMERYFPEVNSPAPLQPFTNPQPHRYTGYYLPSLAQRSSNIEKVMGLLAQFRLTTNPDGTLTLHPGGGFAPTSHWFEVEPGHFQQIDGNGVMIFHSDENNHTKQMYFSYAHMVFFTRLSWYQTTPFHLGLLLTTLLIFLVASIVGLFKFWRKSKTTRQSLTIYYLAALIGILNLLFMIGLAWMLLTQSFALIFGPTPIHYLILALPLPTIPLTLAILIFIVRGWHDLPQPRIIRPYSLLIFGAAISFLWFLHYWNLLGFQF
jgi:CubicO group peptidase (beta-lactamase class C family)